MTARSHLAGALDALPQGEVHHDEHSHQAQRDGPLDLAEVTQPF